MKSKTVFLIPDPFTNAPRVPIAVLVEIDDRVTVEPVDLPADLDAPLTALVGMVVEALREAPSMDALPDSCGPHVVLGPDHDPFKSLPKVVFEALCRATDTPERRAALEEALRKGREDALRGSWWIHRLR